MVVADYLPYGSMYARFVTEHIKRHYAKFLPKYPYIIIGAKCDNFLELVYDFLHPSAQQLDNYIINISNYNCHLIISSNDFTFERLTYTACYRSMIVGFLDSMILEKNQLYEFTQYIINNFKVYDDFQNKIYEKRNNISDFIDNYFEIHAKNKLISIYYNTGLVTNTFLGNNNFHPIIANTGFGDSYVDASQLEELSKIVIALNMLCDPTLTLLQNPNSGFVDNFSLYVYPLDNDMDNVCSKCINTLIKYNYLINSNLMDPNSMLSSYSIDIQLVATRRNRYISSIQEIKKYNSFLLQMPLHSMISQGCDVVDNLDKRMIHKIILKAIDKNDIVCARCVVVKVSNVIFTSERISPKGLARDGSPIDPNSYEYICISGIDEINATNALLAYIINQISPISKTYFITDRYDRSILYKYVEMTPYLEFCKFVLKNNPRINEILKGENNFLKKYLNYGEDRIASDEIICVYINVS